jgi:tetratricopeptide (TPR) repeat protein
MFLALPAALRALVAALALGPGAGWADELQEASKLLKAGQHPQALDQVNKALAANPRDPQPRFLKGLILAEQSNVKEASEIFLKLTQDFPDLPEPYNNLAVIYASQGQYDKARAALERSLRTHPSYAIAYENLGGVYAKLASQAYDRALQTDSTNAGAQNKLVLVREMSGAAPRPVRTAAADKRPVTQTIVAAAPPSAQPQPSAEPQPAAQPKAVAVAKPAQAAPPATADVLNTVNAWAKAWSAKDMDGYLAFYARDFVTPGGEARAEWEKSRRQRIAAPKSIAVAVESPKVTLAADGQASVTFRQSYRSDVIKASSTKTLLLAKADGRWLIRQEKVGR